MILFHRHGEKLVNGNALPVDLSPAGYARAAELPNYFLHHLPTGLEVPEVLIAMKQKKPDSSNRPVETVAPLAAALNLPIHADFTQEQHQKVVKEIETLGADKVVMVVWEHSNLCAIAQLLGAPVQFWGENPTTDDKDDGKDFTSIWVLTKDDQHQHLFEIYREFDVVSPNNTIDYTNVLPTPVYSMVVPSLQMLGDR